MGGSYIRQPGDHSQYAFEYNNPFLVSGCNDTEQGFLGVTALAAYTDASPVWSFGPGITSLVTRIDLTFDTGLVETVGKCNSCTLAFDWKVSPAEVVTGMTLSAYFQGFIGEQLGTFSGISMNTSTNTSFLAGTLISPGGDSGTVNTTVDVGSGFLCGVYGYYMDTSYPGYSSDWEDVIIALGFAFLKPVIASDVLNMTFPDLAHSGVQEEPQAQATLQLDNSLSDISNTVTTEQEITKESTTQWSSTSSLQNTFSTQVGFWYYLAALTCPKLHA